MSIIKKVLIPAAATALMAVAPALAADATAGKPPVTGTDKAVQQINAATSKHIDILTALLSKVPAQAQAGIQKAIDAAQQGHDTAIAAVTGHTASGDTSAQTATTANDKPEVTGLERAKAAVSAGFDKSLATLQGLVGTLPQQAASHVQTAMNNLSSTRTIALQNLDNLIAGQKPDHAAATDHGGHPDAASRPDRPEHPERPQAPVRPERPQVPDHPTPHG
jgi:hypothetical protein